MSSPVMAQFNFQQPFSVSDVPSEIILICWTSAEETLVFSLLSKLKIVVLFNSFVEAVTHIFQDCFMNITLKRTVLIFVTNFSVIFYQLNAFLAEYKYLCQNK